jgi:TPR repeat protein
LIISHKSILSIVSKKHQEEQKGKMSLRIMEKRYLELTKIYNYLYSNSKKMSFDEKQEQYNLFIQGIRKLAYNNFVKAQYDLAQHYEDINFWGVENPFFNTNRRFYWYSKAAENNHAEACNHLGSLYELGEGCKIDLEKSLYFFNKSADLGDDLGKQNLKLFKKQHPDITL